MQACDACRIHFAARSVTRRMTRKIRQVQSLHSFPGREHIFSIDRSSLWSLCKSMNVSWSSLFPPLNYYQKCLSSAERLDR
eukprot:c20103_g1_i1 orf=358-600(+)